MPNTYTNLIFILFKCYLFLKSFLFFKNQSLDVRILSLNVKINNYTLNHIIKKKNLWNYTCSQIWSGDH